MFFFSYCWIHVLLLLRLNQGPGWPKLINCKSSFLVYNYNHLVLDISSVFVSGQFLCIGMCISMVWGRPCVWVVSMLGWSSPWRGSPQEGVVLGIALFPNDVTVHLISTSYNVSTWQVIRPWGKTDWLNHHMYCFMAVSTTTCFDRETDSTGMLWLRHCAGLLSADLWSPIWPC